MTDKAKIERRSSVQGTTAVSGAALSSTLLPKRAAAQAANLSAAVTSDHFDGTEVTVGDNTIFVRRYGSGSPVLMVHGFPRGSLTCGGLWRRSLRATIR